MTVMQIDSKTTEFVLRFYDKTEKRFPGTVAGAVALHNTAKDLAYVSASSDYNHPDEFPNFEEHSIDIAVGYFDDAIAAGIINYAGDDYESFNYGI